METSQRFCATENTQIVNLKCIFFLFVSPLSWGIGPNIYLVRSNTFHVQWIMEYIIKYLKSTPFVHELRTEHLYFYPFDPNFDSRLLREGFTYPYFHSNIQLLRHSFLHLWPFVLNDSMALVLITRYLPTQKNEKCRSSVITSKSLWVINKRPKITPLTFDLGN